MIGEASCIGVMLFDPQVGFMVEQAVQHVGRVANCGINDLRMKRRVLIGEMLSDRSNALMASRRSMCSSKCLAFGIPGGCRSQASFVALVSTR